MLILTYPTQARKLGPIAATYRRGGDSPYSVCPDSCPLKPAHTAGAFQVDKDYADQVFHAVPRKGQAWTYSHFPASSLPAPTRGRTVFNHSADTIFGAAAVHSSGIPAVATVPTGSQIPKRVHGIRFVRCPAEVSNRINCSNCGNGHPLCARQDRDFVVVFTGHGTLKKLVGSEQPGGCYAALGPIHNAWRKGKRPTDDLAPWAKALPTGTYLRHHVAGDIGLDITQPALAAIAA